MIWDELEESGFDHKLPAGIVFTGGSSQLPGLTELGRSTLGMPTRIGYPANHLPIDGLHRILQTPTYATSVGLLLWGFSAKIQILFIDDLTPNQRLWGIQFLCGMVNG